MDISDIKLASRGSERDICVHAGIPCNVIDNLRHQPCSCGGKDRLRITKDYQFFCGGGGSLETGDYIDLICHYTGQSVSDVLLLIKDYLGLNTLDKETKDRMDRSRDKRLNNSKLLSLVKDSNKKNDYEVKESILDLEILIQERGHKIPSLEEIICANNLANLLLTTYDIDQLDKKRKYLKKEWKS